MKFVLVLMGLPGSGKTALANTIEATCGYSCRTISHEDHDEEGMHQAFDQAIQEEIEWIVVDDRNLLKAQRQYYLDASEEADYKAEIIVTSKFDDDEAYSRYAKRNTRGLNKTKISALAETAEMPEKS